MKRILILCAAVVFLVLLQSSPASVGEQTKTPTEWKKLNCVVEKNCKGKSIQAQQLWEYRLGQKRPQVVILKLSEKEFKELEANALGFYSDYGIFGSNPSDRDQGHAVFNLLRYEKSKPKPNDDVLAVLVHDGSTYSAFVGFQVEGIE